MCVVSMVIDHYGDEWRRRYPWVQPGGTIPYPPYQYPFPPTPKPSQQDLEEFKRLLERAREYDKRNSEPECEMAEKKDLLKKLAEKLGVDISFIDDK